MINKFKHIRQFEHVMLKDYTAEKITLYFAVETALEGYDPYENNTTPSNLNPKTIRGYIHQSSPSQNIYKGYGLVDTGIMEIIVDEKYYNWFKIANKIEIKGTPYRVFREGNAEGTPSNPKGTAMTYRSFKMIKVVLVQE